jgi:hypothetical protein
MLDLVGVQKVRWGTESIIRAWDYISFYGKGNENHQLRTGFCINHRIVSAIKTEEVVSDRMSYIVLRGCWCNIIVLNVHAQSEKERLKRQLL